MKSFMSKRVQTVMSGVSPINVPNRALIPSDNPLTCRRYRKKMNKKRDGGSRGLLLVLENFFYNGEFR